MCDANKMVMQIIEVENFYKGGEAIGTGIRSRGSPHLPQAIFHGLARGWHLQLIDTENCNSPPGLDFL